MQGLRASLKSTRSSYSQSSQLMLVSRLRMPCGSARTFSRSSARKVRCLLLCSARSETSILLKIPSSGCSMAAGVFVIIVALLSLMMSISAITCIRMLPRLSILTSIHMFDDRRPVILWSILMALWVPRRDGGIWMACIRLSFPRNPRNNAVVVWRLDLGDRELRMS